VSLSRDKKRRGLDRSNPWLEGPITTEEVDGVVWWTMYAHWLEGGELRAYNEVGSAPVDSVPFFVAFPWLAHFDRIRMGSMSFLKKVVERDGVKKREMAAEWGKWKAKFPALAEWLETDLWPDGSARKTSTLLVFVEGGAVKGCLNDRDGCQSLWASSGSIQGLLEALEGALASGEGEWRESYQGNKGQSGGNRKK